MSNQTWIDVDVLDAWPLSLPRRLRPAEAGTNNLSRFVDTPAGSYFLRIYQNTADTARIRYEHALLSRLQQAGLPFAVPRPLATRHGATYTVLAQAEGRAVAALFPVIAGQHPQRTNAAHALICGEALAVLHTALARIDMDLAVSSPATYGDLAHVHPLVQDPLSLIQDLPLHQVERARLRALFEDLRPQLPDLYDRLPRQIIHGDYGRSNALLRDGRVSGVLDFEFASPDLRAMDVTVALWSFGVAPWQTERDWALIEAIVAGYGQRSALTGAEAAALPTLLRLREATALVHWVGRLRQGLTTADDITERAGRMLDVDHWLQVHGAELLRRVEQALL